MAETVRVIRGEHTGNYIVAEERDDGALLLRPETFSRLAVERGPAQRAPALADKQPVANGQPAVILEVRGLSVAYGIKRAVSDVSFLIGRGEIFGLLGPNGAGKTSTLSAIEGLIEPQSGMVLVGGVDITRHPARAGEDGCAASGNELPVRAHHQANREVVCGPLRHQAG